jgi:hypothetical protein
VENPLQQREVKTADASQQNFTISGVFTNAMGYLMMRLTLAGGLKGVYIVGGNDPYKGVMLGLALFVLHYVVFLLNIMYKGVGRVRVVSKSNTLYPKT